MRIHRGILATVVLVALGLSGISVAAYYWLLHLPHPSVATRDQLLRWLVLRDVAAEPIDVQQALVDRLQTELLAGLNAEGEATVLSDGLRDQLQANVSTLKRVWFEQRTAQYAVCPADEKFAFLERQIAVVAAWSTFQLDVNHDGDLPPDASPASTFFNEIELWIAQSEGERHDQMVRGVQDGLVCWLATRSLQEQPMSIRRDLAVRIARELEYGIDLGDGEGAMSEKHRKQLVANGLLLMEAWLGLQAREYAELDPAEQTTFIDERIEQVERWNVASLAGGDEAGAAADPAVALASLSEQVDVWIERADPSERDAMRLLSDDLRSRIAWRALQKFLPSF